MVITITQEQGRVPVTVFAISGNIDVESVGEFQKTAKKVYQDGTRDLLLDLSEVTYINSSGLRVLHSIFKMLKGGPGTGERGSDEPGPTGWHFYLTASEAAQSQTVGKRCAEDDRF